jgi:hypothetical protein
MPITLAMIAVVAGAASALVYASLLTGTPAAFLLAYLAQLPLFAAGLWMGTGAAVLASAAGMVVTFLTGGFVFAAIYAVANAAPVLVVVRQALRWRLRADGGVEWYPPGGLVVALLCLAGALFVGISLSLADRPGGLEGTLETFIVDAFRRLRGPSGLDFPNIEEFAAQIARLFAGIVAVSWLVMTAINGILGQALVAKAGVNRRPTPAMADIDLPAWLTGLTAIFAAGTFADGFGGFVSRNMIVILIAVYALAGLGVAHALVRNLQWRGMALGAVYGALLVFGWPIAVFAVLGLVEPYANLKARAPQGAPPNS